MLGSEATYREEEDDKEMEWEGGKEGEGGVRPPKGCSSPSTHDKFPSQDLFGVLSQ